MQKWNIKKIFYNFVGTSPCCVSFVVSKIFMILLMHSGLLKSKRKLLVVSMFYRITFILGWFWYFSMVCLIVTTSLSEESLVRPSTPRFWTMFPKYLLKISTNSLSSETTLLFSTKVIRSSFKVVSVKEGFAVFQKSLFSVMYFTLSLLQNSFLVFLIVSHRNFFVFYIQI